MAITIMILILWKIADNVTHFVLAVELLATQMQMHLNNSFRNLAKPLPIHSHFAFQHIVFTERITNNGE